MPEIIHSSLSGNATCNDNGDNDAQGNEGEEEGHEEEEDGDQKGENEGDIGASASSQPDRIAR